MAINYSGALVAELRARAAAGVPIRTLAEESGLARGTVFGLIHGQHGIRTETAREALASVRENRLTPLIVDSTYNDARAGVDRATGLPLFHPARHEDSSKIGKWWRAEQDVKDSRFTNFEPLRQFRGSAGRIRVIGADGKVHTIQLPSDRDRDVVLDQVRLLDTGEPLDVNRAGSGLRGRRRVS